MKTLTPKPKQKTQRKTSKHKQAQPKGKVSAANAVVLDETPEQLSAYDSYYKQLSEEVESIERHVHELRQTPGLEDLTEAEAQAQVDFMLRFSAWIFNQHLSEQWMATIEDEDLLPKSAKVSKVQKPKGKSNKKVTKSLSR
ncbi:hypothetical protein [Pontibacter fetidus]|uniref:Uncharacterized protein n=1 Tax=Pontibacter fetidus TaxID=2700082 RepID=A0A6B2H233_9BACT|nr:hypothetical protein [Pontibacter fetidus]NDK56431.1 hypothetical protein [Pontibacter fetidus]